MKVGLELFIYEQNFCSGSLIKLFEENVNILVHLNKSSSFAAFVMKPLTSVTYAESFEKRTFPAVPVGFTHLLL